MEEFCGVRVAPVGIEGRYLAFDITPNELVSGIITDRGIARPPYVESLSILRELPQPN